MRLLAFLAGCGIVYVAAQAVVSGLKGQPVYFAFGIVLMLMAAAFWMYAAREASE